MIMATVATILIAYGPLPSRVSAVESDLNNVKKQHLDDIQRVDDKVITLRETVARIDATTAGMSNVMSDIKEEIVEHRRESRKP